LIIKVIGLVKGGNYMPITIKENERRIKENETVVCVDDPEVGVTLFIAPIEWCEKHKIENYGMSEYHKLPEEVVNDLYEFPELEVANYFFIE